MLMATVLDCAEIDIEYSHHYRKLYWTVLLLGQESRLVRGVLTEETGENGS